MERKGISPIIASVLLLAVSLAVVGIFSGWAPELARTVTDDTENSTIETLNCNEAGLDIVSAFYSSTDSEINTTVRNNGEEDLPSVTLAAFNSDEQLITQETGINLSQGELNSTTIEDVTEDPSYIEGYSTSCTSVTSTLDDISQ